MRIFVTGGAGYVGSHAVRRFRQAGHDPWVFDNLSAGHAAAVGNSPLFVGDLADADALDEALGQARFDAVVHFAGVANVGDSVREPLRYYRQNFTHSLGLLEAMTRHRIGRLVVSSSCTVYGNPATVPVNEESATTTINPYARSKLAMEWAINDCARATGLGCVILRYFNAAGAHTAGDLGEDHTPETHLIPAALEVALGKRLNLQICGTDYPTPDGTCVRDYVHVEDLAEAHLSALGRIAAGETRVCNLGSGTPYSVREVIAMCREVTGARIPAVETPRRPGDAAALHAGFERARTLLDWFPRHSSLREIVETAWHWHRLHPQGYADRVLTAIPEILERTDGTGVTPETFEFPPRRRAAA